MSIPKSGCGSSQWCRAVTSSGTTTGLTSCPNWRKERIAMLMFAEPSPGTQVPTQVPTVSEVYRFVVGVDTHAKVHQYAIVEAATGRVLDEGGFPTSGAGLARAAAWIARRTGGDLDSVLISCEGTGSYGARLAKLLGEAGYRVVDAPCPKRDRGQDKDDTIDAIKAARSVLGKRADRLADVRAGELQEALKVLLAARDRMATESTRSVNALTALRRGVDVGIDARRKLTSTQIRHVARWRTRSESPAPPCCRSGPTTDGSTTRPPWPSSAGSLRSRSSR